MKLLCLLPVRNGEHDLPGYFESAARFADAIVALDDGSDDGTLELLEREPLVVEVLTNPVRHGYRGWHDAANRNRLLQAAGPHRPDWIISVDADERIDPGDATALRAFLETDALPGIAYGFRCYSMAGDLRHALPNPIWVYRMFAWQPGQAFPDQQLHFAPIPTSISRRAFLRTTFRIQHLGGMSLERRLARYEKYRQADPDCRYWPDYAGLLKEPAAADVVEWETREPSWPAIFAGHIPSGRAQSGTGAGRVTGRATITVVVLDTGLPAGVQRAIASAERQSDQDKDHEIVFVTRAGSLSTETRAHTVTVAADATPGAMRNAGIAAATGDVLLFLDGDMALQPGALGMLMSGFNQGFASVTGGIVDRSEGAAGATFADQFDAIRAGRSGAILERPIPWAAYSKTLLTELGGFDEMLSGGVDEDLGRRIAAAGYVTLRLGESVLAYHGDSMSSRSRAVLAAFARGRSEAQHRLAAAADRGRLLSTTVRRPPTGRPAAGWEIRTARRAGTWTEFIRPQRGKAQVLLGRPGGVALVAANRSAGDPVIAMIRFRLSVPELRVVVLPADLSVPAPDTGLTTLEEALFANGSTGLDRFTVNDAIGRPFQTRIDDVITIDGDSSIGSRIMAALKEVPAPGQGSLRNQLDRRCTAAAAWWATRTNDVQSSVSGMAAVLGLMRLSRITPDRIEVVRPFEAGAVLDEDGVELVLSFLRVDEIVRPRTKRDSLREVEWA